MIFKPISGNSLLRDLYFQAGGMYLSEETGDSYKDLQETISVTVQRRSGNITDDNYERIRSKCSMLRTEITNDIKKGCTYQSQQTEEEGYQKAILFVLVLRLFLLKVNKE